MAHDKSSKLSATLIKERNKRAERHHETSASGLIQRRK